MTAILVDTSIVIKWFHSDGESELDAARSLRDAHVAGRVDAHILDLAMYEVGNVLVRALAWAAAARSLGIALVSADRQLLAAGVAESATTVAQRLGLAFVD